MSVTSGTIVVLSKDELALDDTLRAVSAQLAGAALPFEVVVVDASAGRLEAIRRLHDVRWIDFPPEAEAITIAAQRNAGVRASAADVMVFIDAGCWPVDQWLRTLVAPIVAGRAEACAGRELGSKPPFVVAGSSLEGAGWRHEAPSLNLAFTRAAFDRVEGFDERFAYGSDIDFTWRLTDAGIGILDVPEAVVAHDWGGVRRRVRRGWHYGRARTRLYRKHPKRLTLAWRTDPMILVWPLFVAGLPLAIPFPPYLALLLIPTWRNRRDLTSLADHLAYGAGALFEFARLRRS